MTHCRLGYVPAIGLVVLVCLPGLAWPGLAATQPLTPPVGASAQLVDARGRMVAQATLREAPDQVLISLSFADRAALVGTHAIQIHAVGRCDPPDFTTAGGIFNPYGKQHGLKNPDGPMAGDVPSLVIGPNGVSSYNTSAPRVKLGSGPAALLQPQGTSLVIFAQADDDQSQPEGNAGARIACGVILGQAPAAPPRTIGSLVQGGQPPASRGDPDLLTATFIAALGALMIGAGILLRRAPQPRR